MLGIPEDVIGESVKVFVVLRANDANGLTERVTSFCKSRLIYSSAPWDDKYII